MTAIRTVALAVTLVVLSAGAASAQQLQRSLEVQGWTPTGNEFVGTALINGTVANDAGDDEEFSYRLLQVYNANDGSVLRSFRQGSSSGPVQTPFQNAESAPDGRAFLQQNAVTEPTMGNHSPDGNRYVAVSARTLTRPSQTEECADCRACQTSYQIIMFDESTSETIMLDSGTRDGPRVPADVEPPCVEIEADTYWSSADDRLAIVMHESTEGATPFDTLYLFNFANGTGTYQTTSLTRLEYAVPYGEHREEFQSMVDSLASAPDRTILMRRLGVLAARMGDRQAARDYLEIAAEDEETDEIEFWIAFLDYLEGDEGELRDARRSADDAEMQTEEAICHYLDDDLEEAQELLGMLGTDFALELLRYNLTSGLRALGNATLDGRNAGPEMRRTLALTLLDAGREDEAARLMQDADQLDPADFATILRILVQQERYGDVTQQGYSRLFEDPGNCGLYYALGRAEFAAGDLNTATSLLGMATVCDPNDTDAAYFLARAHWQERDFDAATDAGRRFMRVAGARNGDRVRRERRAEVGSYMDRTRSPDVILYSYECTGTVLSGRTCTGTILNPTDAPVTGVTVLLKAVDEDGDLLDGVQVAHGTVAAGEEVSFEARLMRIEDIDEPSEARILLNVTGPDSTRYDNQVDVGVGF